MSIISQCHRNVVPKILAAVLAAGLVQGARASTLFSNFEQPTYPAAPAAFIGTDGWIDYFGSSGLTPDPLGSGYVTVLEGSQSAWVAGGVGRGWGSTASYVFDQFNASALFEGPDGDSSHASIYFSNDIAAGLTPGGIEANGDHFDVFGFNGISVSTGVPYVLTHVYRLTMAIDIPNWQFTPTIEDLTVPSVSTPGTYPMYPFYPANQMTLAYVQANGGLLMAGSGVWDEMLVPEPASLALLALGGLAVRRRSRA